MAELIWNELRIIYRYDPVQGRIFIVNVIHGSRLLKEGMLTEQES